MPDIYDGVLARRLNGERLHGEEGVLLYSCDLLRLGKAAQILARRNRPDSIVTFVVDRNVSYTNTCVVDCGFCAFNRRPGDAQGYTLSREQVLEKVRELVDWGGTQVLIQGGVNPDLSLEYYFDLVRSVHEKFPQVHIHSFSVTELEMLSGRFHIPLADLLKNLKEAGLNSLPGGGAEILTERVRKLLSPRKTSSSRWLEVMRTAHEAGLRSTATMVFGHCETLEERILHMIKIRELQDQTHGFRAFIPWTLSSHGTPRMSHLKPAGGEDYLKTIAISRLMLDNIEHIQSGWLTEGLKLGQVALAFGCDDMGGTLFEDKVLEPTGLMARTRREDLIRLIREAGYIPAQRDTNYKILHIYGEESSSGQIPLQRARGSCQESAREICQ